MYETYARAAGAIAREAGRFLRRFSETRRLDIENKGGEFDFVTNADRESQALTACGRLDAYRNPGVHPWDVAAGVVILEEAGGTVSDPFGFDMPGGILREAPGLRGQFGAHIRRT